MNVEQVRTHIANLIREKGKNLRSVSLAIGKNEAYLHQFIHKGSPLRLPEEDRRKMADLLNVDEQELTDIKLPNTITPVLKHARTALIEMISPNVSCGTVGFLSFPLADFANMTTASADTIKAVRISGDSMAPTLKDGDYILADISQSAFTTDGLYLISLSDNLVVKRLQQINDTEFLVLSDNTNYKSVTMDLKNITIAGKIVYVFKGEKLA